MLMMIAHLQSEGLSAAHAVSLAAAEASDPQDADQLLASLRGVLREPAAAPGHTDLGTLLCSFLERFGKRFRYIVSQAHYTGCKLADRGCYRLGCHVEGRL